jgi:hypothetical protein
MCFARPVDVHDLDKGGKFSFGVTPPGGVPLGLRIVVQQDGHGVAVYPGRLPSNISEQGDWKFEWLVRDPPSMEEGHGSLTFDVVDGGDEILKDPPDVCPGEGVSRTGSAGASVSPTATAAGSGRDEENEPDVLKLALLTVGAAGAAGVVGLLGYAVRTRVGFWLHRPPERNGDGDEGHH